MIRKLLENYTIAWNTPLREVVPQMSPVILLRNCHPYYRATYAFELMNDGIISKDEYKEFAIFAGR